mmetsp:Transcript_962/g.595  ORF Transcript_962/g.595 Transcript_962/m.595 type:complete len:101 (-) Transcript_962:84-386(-)|eukprot:CAMPEP_0202966976 /NCGR_PEP_ID=MMETSP1396-20130829/11672_1 /ASSEMBLY_ACC=CAM_ASM_000872 /TAXON_ID= /ORGANISM="Pseudokeronopsis sp., Strain Brazil" /LENGTH=100 /DNA_ID=CAMNT_0049691491 /DNA_START=675 /DNA_END=974 /DNA_ORIENTATION=+
MSLFTSRDFIVLKTISYPAHNKAVVAFQSLWDEDLIIEQKETVRGHINISGWVLEQLGEREVKAAHIMSLELGGNLPFDFKNVLLKQRFLTLENLQEIIA